MPDYKKYVTLCVKLSEEDNDIIAWLSKLKEDDKCVSKVIKSVCREYIKKRKGK